MTHVEKQRVFEMKVGKRIDCPTFANGWSAQTWHAHYIALTEKRKASSNNRLYKTSREWFQLLYADKMTILDIDGWRTLPDINFYWNTVPITHVEYEQRFGECTVSAKLQK